MFLQKVEITLKTLNIVGVTSVCLHIFETSYRIAFKKSELLEITATY